MSSPQKIVVLQLGNGYVVDDANNAEVPALVAKGVEEVLYQVRCLLTGEGVSLAPAPEAEVPAPVVHVITEGLAPGSSVVTPGDMWAIRERVRRRVWARMAEQKRGGA